MSLKRFFDRINESRRSLLVANRSSPDPIQNAIEATFDDQPVQVGERTVPDVDADTVLLVDDNEILATSPLSALRDTIVTVNSDLYSTGAKRLEDLDLPTVLGHLDDIRFTLRGYPKSHSEKLLLIVISRYIERVAWHTGQGRHRASFQYLSRIEDERGTRRVYERLGDTDVDVHVYGLPDWDPAKRLEVTTHAGHGSDFRDSWFVLFTPSPPSPDTDAPDPPRTDHGPVALLAIETEPQVWEGFWTFDPSLVADLNTYIAREL